MNKAGRTSWILVEAKAQLDELSSECAARSRARPIIEHALATTRESLEISPEHDWLAPHYQFCNRVAILDFLLSHGVTAEVLFIYFTGDNVPRNASIVWRPSTRRWAGRATAYWRATCTSSLCRCTTSRYRLPLRSKSDVRPESRLVGRLTFAAALRFDRGLTFVAGQRRLR
jgi:hypothetical protein